MILFNKNCTHQKKRLDQRTRIPEVFGGPFQSAALVVDFDSDFVDETTAAAEQRRPEVLERRLPSEQLRLFDVSRNCDAFLAVLATQTQEARDLL